MPDLTINRSLFQQTLQHLHAFDGPIVCRLYTNMYSPTVDDTTSDYTEAAYAGYPGTDNTIPVTPYTSQGNEEIMATAGMDFAAPTSGGNDTIYGIYITWNPADIGGYHVLMAAEFGTPVVMSVGGSTLPLLINLACLDLNNP